MDIHSWGWISKPGRGRPSRGVDVHAQAFIITDCIRPKVGNFCVLYRCMNPYMNILILFPQRNINTQYICYTWFIYYLWYPLHIRHPCYPRYIYSSIFAILFYHWYIAYYWSERSACAALGRCSRTYWPLLTAFLVQVKCVCSPLGVVEKCRGFY